MRRSGEASADDLLLRRWRGGDASAGAELVARHLAAVRGFLARRSGGDAEDLVQQTFLACVEGAHRYRGSSSFRTYLTGIAMNQLLALRRRAKRGPCSDTSRDPVDVTEEPAPPSSSAMWQAREEALMRAVEDLPGDLRMVLDLAYWKGLPLRRIATIVGIPAGTVASRLRRAKERLREILLTSKLDADLCAFRLRTRDLSPTRDPRASLPRVPARPGTGALDGPSDT